MAVTGGRTPYDKTNAAAGPARVLWADPADVDIADVDDLYSIVPGVADANGEYPAVAGWNDFGLAADAPSYTHDKDTEGLEYQQTAGVLFEQISEITRSFTAQIAEISPENLKIIENADTIETIAAAANKAAQKKVAFGLYENFKQYRIAMVMYRPTGAGTITEPAPSGRTRPPAVALVLPLVSLAAEGTDVEVDRSDPVNAEVEFTVFPEPTLGSNEEHGFWVFEQSGVISAV